MAVRAGMMARATVDRGGAVERAAFRAGLKDIAPVVMGLTPFGLAIGAAIAETELSHAAGWAGSWLLFNGSAQVAAVSGLGAGAAAGAVIGTVLVIGARLVIYSAALRGLFAEQPSWFRWIAPYFLVDPLYVVVADHAEGGGPPVELRWYYLGAALGIWFAWLPTVALGILLGPALPDALALDFAIPALLLAMLVPSVRSRAAVGAALVGGAVALVGAAWPGGIGLVLGVCCGSAVGALIERGR